MARNEPNRDSQSFGALLFNVFKGFVISLVVSVFILLVFAVVMNTADSELLTGGGGSRVLAALAVCIGAFVGSAVTASKIRKRGFLLGGFIGGGMYLLILLLSIVALGKINLSGFYPYLLLLCLLVSGAAGGITGANLRRISRKR